MNRTCFPSRTRAQLYELAALYLRRHDGAASPIEREGWRQLLTEVTNEIVLREVAMAA